MTQNLKRALHRLGDGRIFLKISAPPSFINTYKMSLISGGSISLDSTLNQTSKKGKAKPVKRIRIHSGSFWSDIQGYASSCNEFPVFVKGHFLMAQRVSRNQCCGSMTFWGGSGSGDPCLWLMDPEQDPDPDPYLWLVDPDPGGPKTCGSGRSGSRSATLAETDIFSHVGRIQNTEPSKIPGSDSQLFIKFRSPIRTRNQIHSIRYS